MIENLKNKKWCHKQYWTQERSVGDIAKELGTYPNKVRRALKSHGIKLRGKGSAQSVALKKGRSIHPTKDKGHSEESKTKISESVAANWENLSEKDLEARRESARKQWQGMTEEHKKKLRELAVPGIKKASQEGSKMEKYLRDELTKHGYVIEYHKKGIVPNSNLEIDIYLPEIGVAIEIDGPSHFLPIWGEEALKKTIKSDNEKNGLLRYHGVIVLRVSQKRKTTSKKAMRDTWKAIEKALVEIEIKKPEKNNRFKEIKV
jgi:very-short-patch-repair endonuclease